MTSRAAASTARSAGAPGIAATTITSADDPHPDVDALGRIQIVRDLRRGEFDVLVGINLLREGLDMPEVSLVGILDADKGGLLRSERSLIQTIGRAARNLRRVLLYADKETDSIKLTVGETNRRRALQQAFNEEHGIAEAVSQSAQQWHDQRENP